MFNKTTKHLFVWLGLMLALAISVTAAQNTEPLPCRFVARCSSEGPGVWATDNERCFVFANACQLGNENCQRENESQKALTVVPKTECQKLCAKGCPKVYLPVCASYNGNYRTFDNSCELSKHICTTGELYSFFRDGACGSASK